MSATDFFIHASTFQVVEVGFLTYHYDVFDKVRYLLMDIYHQETNPMTTVLTFKDTSANRERVSDCYQNYINSGRYKKNEKIS